MQRKLDIGTTISQVFATYGAQAAVLLPAAAVIFIPLAIISGILRNNGSIILGLLATLVSIVGTYWYAGIVVNAVRDIRDGRRDLSLGELFAASAPYILPLFGAAVIFGICVFVSAIFFVIPGIVLGVFWCLFAPAIVVERVGVFRSFGRSIELVKGNWWAIFAVFLLFLLMLIVAAIVLGAIFFAIIDSVAGRIIADAITNILFAPDQHLGRFLMKTTGRTDGNMVLYPGSCMVHEIFSEKEIVRLKMENPDAQVLAHPECEERVLSHADFIGSTSALIKKAVESPARRFIIATEPGVIHEMQKRAPDKEFIPAPAEGGCACNQCPHMRKNTLERVYLALRDLTPRLELPESLRLAALRPMEKMLSLS